MTNIPKEMSFPDLLWTTVQKFRVLFDLSGVIYTNNLHV